MRAHVLLACSVLVGCASALKPVSSKVVTGAAQGDPSALYAGIRKQLRDIDAEPSAERREAMAVEAVQLGQRCEQAAPGNPWCAYGLALALGVQAREKPSTARDGLSHMVKRLERVAQTDPSLDRAGPERVLAFVLARSPGWPTGPGDPEAAVESARKATHRDAAYAPNWLALAEAADAIGDAQARRDAAKKALTLADVAARSGEADAAAWQRDANKFLQK